MAGSPDRELPLYPYLTAHENLEPNFEPLVKLAVKMLLYVAGMQALQFWLSMRLRSFTVAPGVGIIGFVICSLLLE